jgi:hypothetical protein
MYVQNPHIVACNVMGKREPLTHRRPADSAWHRKLRELAEKNNIPLGVPSPNPQSIQELEKPDYTFSKLVNIDPVSQSAANAKTKRDRQLSEEDYKTVFAAFKDTGNPQELAVQTGRSVPDIEHLLNYGVARLGLPPIRERAVNQELIDVGLRAALAELEKPQPLTYKQTKEAAQGATDRATRETAAAQILLESGLTAAKVIQAYTEKLKDLTEQGLIETPDAVTPDTIAKLSKSFSDFARGMAAIVQISQNTALDSSRGNSMAFSAAQLIDKMNADEMAIFIRKKHIPRHLRAGGGQQIDSPKQEVIDIEEDKDNSIEKVNSQERAQLSPVPVGASSEIAPGSEEVKS